MAVPASPAPASAPANAAPTGLAAVIQSRSKGPAIHTPRAYRRRFELDGCRDYRAINLALPPGQRSAPPRRTAVASRRQCSALPARYPPPPIPARHGSRGTTPVCCAERKQSPFPQPCSCPSVASYKPVVSWLSQRHPAVPSNPRWEYEQLSTLALATLACRVGTSRQRRSGNPRPGRPSHRGFRDYKYF